MELREVKVLALRLVRALLLAKLEKQLQILLALVARFENRQIL